MPVENPNAIAQAIGNYDLVEKIAEGGMGTVYRGRNRLTGEIVAVKVVPQHLLSNPVVLKRFEQEYFVARAIDHPNIVKALDFGREGETRYLVMEYVEGESLGQKIEREGKLPETEAIRIITLVALGLQKAHKQGLVHRDVKPDNILITPDGSVKLTDLGLVKEVEADLNLTRTGRGLGTPHFMSPEQFRNAKKADARCDIYSLGATLYMMVTGELPFKSNGPLDAWMKKINNEIDPPRQLNPELSERTDWAIRRAISPDPAHRPESCREFVEDLTGQSTQMSAVSPTLADVGTPYWYMVYTDDIGVVHTVKGTAKGIRRSFKEGLLGDAENIRVALTKSGPFESLKTFPEFRDLVVDPSSVPTPLKKSDPKTVAPPVKPLRSLPAKESIQDAPAPTDSAVLSTTTLMPAVTQAAAKPAPPAQPTIALPTNGSAFGDDFFKWLLLGILFVAVGVSATYLLPYLRYLRLFW
ncbi:MAG: serine/threonine protein kinase [Planctomycetes bacterium]|nr:serine/threonine protein kinase [Planctomycetota bacterium]